MTIKNKDSTTIFRNLCIIAVWSTAIYSAIIQHMFQIPYGMILLGFATLISYIMANIGEPFVISEKITEEDIRMLLFMAYVLFAGLIFAPDRSNHISQWITCLEYLFIQIIIASIIKCSGTDTFHVLLVIESIILAVIFISHPVDYSGAGRYSISKDVNPNGLGLGFAAGIWAVLYRQQKTKRSFILSCALVAIFLYCIVLTGSRKSLIGASITVVLWFVLCFLPNLRGKATWKGIISFFLILILSIIICRMLINMYVNNSIATRMDNLFYEASEGNRSDMYYEGFELIKNNPIFGIGFQGFKYYYHSYSHATLVEIPVSSGIIGTIIYFSIFFLSIKKLLYAYKNTKNDSEFKIEHLRIKMDIILWIVMAFYTICIIHPYQFDSFILFGIIFGETAYIDRRLTGKMIKTRMIGSKYIKYE